MWLKWLPLKFIVRRLAHSHGFMDPISILSHLRRFSQPSEVNEPIELLRAGVVLHARGLINSRVIQQNLDWIWPFWVNQQFNPEKEAFIPRAFSMTTINLTGRNWTAVGLPGRSDYPIIDPRGLVMPFWDSWSIDAWIIGDNKPNLYPSELTEGVEQKYNFTNGLSVDTHSKASQHDLFSKTQLQVADSRSVCSTKFTAVSEAPGWLVISLRPYNPEGISFIHKIVFDKAAKQWTVNDKNQAFLSQSPDKHIISDFERGDVALKLPLVDEDSAKVKCPVGMATVAALYRLNPGQSRTVEMAVPLDKQKTEKNENFFQLTPQKDLWDKALKDTCSLKIDYKNFDFLYQAAIRSVILHSPAEVYPGPFTYKRFWFRDAAFIVYAMIKAGLVNRAETMIDNFILKQTSLGYFHSQEGEWDSNGQTLWVINQYRKLSGKAVKQKWLKPVINAAKWISRKRTSRNSGKNYEGLLPAGFSAEHFGPNDYYYWDDFWAVAGLKAAAEITRNTKYHDKAEEFEEQADDLQICINKSIEKSQKRLGRAAIPVSVNRRLDSAAIGSLSACYPLDLFDANDERIKDTVDYLMQNCILKDAFYHDISHSGINAYLTMDLAQVLMTRNDGRFRKLIESIASFASPTGQWPEAINPRTGLGCMGDGQHIWAAAEWVILLINCFVKQQQEKIVIGSGIFPEWLQEGKKVSINSAVTSYGSISIEISTQKDNINVSWNADWYDTKPEIEVKLPGFAPVEADLNKNCVNLER